MRWPAVTGFACRNTFSKKKKAKVAEDEKAAKKTAAQKAVKRRDPVIAAKFEAAQKAAKKAALKAGKKAAFKPPSRSRLQSRKPPAATEILLPGSRDMCAHPHV